MLIWPKFLGDWHAACAFRLKPNTIALKSDPPLPSRDSKLRGLSRLSSKLESRLCRSFCRSGVYLLPARIWERMHYEAAGVGSRGMFVGSSGLYSGLFVALLASAGT